MRSLKSVISGAGEGAGSSGCTEVTGPFFLPAPAPGESARPALPHPLHFVAEPCLR